VGDAINFIGIDLAWSEKNEIFVDIAYSNDDIIEKIKPFFTEKCMIGIDAPLTVKNEFGLRDCEREINSKYRKFHAGVHPSNRKILSSYAGGPRGEKIVRLLRKHTFIEDPKMNYDRSIIEVYPHASMVELFDLEKIIPYKPRKQRTLDMRKKSLKRYYDLFEKFMINKYSLSIKEHLKFREIGKTQKSFKLFEDKLDSLFCSLITRISFEEDKNRMIFGSKTKGHIVIVKR
jgi:predicted RNase H-like nuclease